MISRARIKWIKSLEMRKYRLQNNAFVAEGPKLVGELLPYSTPIYVAATKEWLAQNDQLLGNVKEVDEVSREELERASLLRTPQSVLAVMPIPKMAILRIADWFGIRHVLCTEGTVDVYNPKCVQSCMGALARVEVYYCNLPEVLKKAKVPVYGTFLNGTDIYKEEISPNGIIVMGNEGNGISKEVESLVSCRLYVPNFPAGSLTTESLNVAVATGIVCAEFRRRNMD